MSNEEINHQSINNNQAGTSSASSPLMHQQHLVADIAVGGGMAAGLKRAISQVSMLVFKATTSGEVAWREECQKYIKQKKNFFSCCFCSIYCILSVCGL